MRTYKWLFIGGSIMLLASFLSLFFDTPYRVSATSGPNCDLQKCSFVDTTINDFQVGQFTYTSLNNATGDGSVQLLPVGLTSPWITDTYNIGTPRAELTAVAYKDWIYVIGGLDNSDPRHPLKQILKATTSSDGSIASPGFTAVSGADLPYGRSGASAVISTTASGAWLFVLGGNTEDQYDNPFITSTIYYNFINTSGNFPEPSNWRMATMPPYSYPPGELVYYQAVVHNGYLYVINGADYGTVNSPYIDIYRASIDSATGALGSWQEETNLPDIPRESFAAATWQGPSGTDFLYILGGLRDYINYIPEAQVDRASFNNVDGSLNSFTSSGAALPLGYYAHGAVQSNNVLYVTAGNPGGSEDNITTTVQSALIDTDGSLRNIIEGTTNPWITSNPLPQGRKYHATVIGSNNGEVYVIGGYGPAGTGTNTVYHGSTRGIGANYAPNGNYTSKIINMADQRNINKIVVNTTITNPVTMTLQYRYGNAIDALGAWNNLPNVPVGVNVSSEFSVNFTASYIQYRGWFTASTVSPRTIFNLSPALNSFEVRYPPPPTPTPTATTPPTGNTPTPTRVPGIPDFTILGLQSPASTEAFSQTITVRVANQGTGFNRQPISRQSSTAVFGQQTTPRGAKRVLPRGLSRTPLGTNSYFVYLEMYVDPSVPPTQVTQLGNCPTIDGGTNWAWIYALGAGEYVDVPIECYINSGTHQFYSQVDSCDDVSGVLCSTSYGYVQEGYETNNIFGPVPSGSSIQGGIHLPYIKKSP